MSFNNPMYSETCDLLNELDRLEERYERLDRSKTTAKVVQSKIKVIKFILAFRQIYEGEHSLEQYTNGWYLIDGKFLFCPSNLKWKNYHKREKTYRARSLKQFMEEYVMTKENKKQASEECQDIFTEVIDSIAEPKKSKKPNYEKMFETMVMAKSSLQDVVIMLLRELEEANDKIEELLVIKSKNSTDDIQDVHIVEEIYKSEFEDGILFMIANGYELYGNPYERDDFHNQMMILRG